MKIAGIWLDDHQLSPILEAIQPLECLSASHIMHIGLYHDTIGLDYALQDIPNWGYIHWTFMKWMNREGMQKGYLALEITLNPWYFAWTMYISYMKLAVGQSVLIKPTLDMTWILIA